MEQWRPFHFDDNKCWGEVGSPEVFKSMLARYGGDLEKFLSARRSSRSLESMPNFGFRGEHVGPQTLGEWLRENNIDLSFAKRK